MLKPKVSVQKQPALTNWNLTEKTKPECYVIAERAEDVCDVVKNPAFPSPVLAVGSMHSVTGCVTNPEGTIINVSALNAIKGIEGSGVRVEAGVKLADLHDWLRLKDLEISFSPEIGDATVGSLVVCTSKDSSIDGPGFLSGLVTEVTYVDEAGSLVTLTMAKHPAELMAFTCSYGMMGIVVEAVLQVRPRIAVTTHAYTFLTKSGAKAAAHLSRVQSSCDALFAILVPSRDYVYIEARSKASKAAALLASSAALSAAATLGVNDLVRKFMFRVKYNCFLYGDPLSRKMSVLVSTGNPPTTHFRRKFVNRYPAVQPGSRRLDFSFVEFDFSNFEQVVSECWQFHHDYKERTGFAPSGYGMYFVHRAWGSDKPDAPRKPSGNFSGPPGISFMLDPITGVCDDPRWAAFNVEYTAWAVSRGATPSLSQTKGLQPGQVLLPKELTRPRFLTPFFANFVA